MCAVCACVWDEEMVLICGSVAGFSYCRVLSTWWRNDLFCLISDPVCVCPPLHGFNDSHDELETPMTAETLHFDTFQCEKRAAHLNGLL